MSQKIEQRQMKQMIYTTGNNKTSISVMPHECDVLWSQSEHYWNLVFIRISSKFIFMTGSGFSTLL